MKNLSKLTALIALAATTPLAAQDTEKPKMLSPGQIVDQAAPDEWQTIAASDLLIMNLIPDAKGKDRTVIIQLMPPPFSQGWVRNIRKLAKANWWDGTSINRVQDNYVVQWGDPAEEEADRKPLPGGLEMMTEGDYSSSGGIQLYIDFLIARGSHKDGEKWQFEPSLTNADPYSDRVGIYSGWPIATRRLTDGTISWPVHCYGALGVGRGLTPDTGSGAELYTVIGHAPRHLDRNIAVVGRIIEGMHHLSSLPRGFGPLGFYETPKERVPIQSIRLASELPKVDQPQFQYLDTDSGSFSDYAHRRANREPPFFIKPAGGADICNIPVPVRRVKGE